MRKITSIGISPGKASAPLAIIKSAEAFTENEMFTTVGNELNAFEEAKALMREIQCELQSKKIPFDSNVKTGIMIETPAAAIISDKLAQIADFFSIGSNDLAQYTLACDRNSQLDRYYDPKHPAVLRFIETAAQNAHNAGIPVGICGELAADEDLTEFFLNIGIDELSVSPKAVLSLRKRIIEI